MHPVLENIKNELQQLLAVTNTGIPSNEPFNVAHGNWSFPGLSKADLLNTCQSIISMIEATGGESIKTNEKLLEDYPRRLSFLRTNTIQNIWPNPAAGVPAYLNTLYGLKDALEPTLAPDPATIKEAATQATIDIKRILTQLRGIEASVRSMAPRANEIEEMINRIKMANETADRLPTDLASLKEAHDEVAGILGTTTKTKDSIETVFNEAVEFRKRLETKADEAAVIIDRCDEAYRTSTSEGLASAFSERAKKLNSSMWVWVAGLVIALVISGTHGVKQLNMLADVMSKSTPGNYGIVWFNLILALLSIGGPVWLAWVATKQIGQRFRLAEDYGYKATISKAYEGYRREALKLDPKLELRLFDSALTRLDEMPLRLVETHTHGSPWHELFSSKLIKDAVQTVPGFPDKVIDLARDALQKMPTVSKTRKETEPNMQTEKAEQAE